MYLHFEFLLNIAFSPIFLNFLFIYLFFILFYFLKTLRLNSYHLNMMKEFCGGKKTIKTSNLLS